MSLMAAIISAPLAFAFGAGMLAAVNPCGFAMLPAYLSYFVGSEGASSSDGPSVRAIPRALGVGAALTSGFILVFGIMGLIISQVSSAVQDHLKWVTIVIGIALVILGIFLLSGRQLTLKLPKLQKGGSSREFGSMFLFGVSYATASLTCTIGPFIGVTSSTFNNDGFGSGVAAFLAYALGMGAIITGLTVAVAMARQSLVRWLRNSLQYVNRISGAMVLLAGVYVAYYGWYEVRLGRSSAVVRDPIIDRAQDIQADISNWIITTGTNRLGIIFGIVVAVGVGATVLARRIRVARTIRSGQGITVATPAALGDEPKPVDSLV